jgi:putative transposase
MLGHTVGAALDRVLGTARRLRSITVDHGTEFQSRALEDWAYRRRGLLDFIPPAKPWKTRSSSRSTGDSGTNV